MNIVGIDNGLSGGLAIIDDERRPADNTLVFPMPVIFNLSKRVVDELEVFEFLDNRGAEHVFIEGVQPNPQWQISAVTSLVTCQALVRGMCVAMEIPYTIVPAQAWQKAMFKGTPCKKGQTKVVSVQVAKRLFPKVSLLRTPKCTKPSDGMSDALLIAEYGRRQLQGA